MVSHPVVPSFSFPLHPSASAHVTGLCTRLLIIQAQPSCLKTRGRNRNNSVLQGYSPRGFGVFGCSVPVRPAAEAVLIPGEPQ